MLIVHELAEDVKLFPQELVGKINLMEQTNKKTWSNLKRKSTKCTMRWPSCTLTVVFIIPVPCVRMELAMWRMLMVFKCLLLLAFSMKILKTENAFYDRNKHLV